MKISELFKISLPQDFLKGLFYAVIGGVIAIIAPSIQNGTFIFDWTVIWHTAVATGLAYISGKFITPAPKTVQIDPSKTAVVDKQTKEVIIEPKPVNDKP